ncbi:hypothetical protein [Vibrio lentus]|uniref:hypothetical protein n=1 Tax=Vibrio lentus TaxID=136468 RepID=UPI0013001183|nr:hypothetical protein [Vibrio lentus]
MKTNQSLFSPHFQSSREKAGDNENTMTMPAFRVGKSFLPAPSRAHLRVVMIQASNIGK